jgi:hypothetical protein
VAAIAMKRQWDLEDVCMRISMRKEVQASMAEI